MSNLKAFFYCIRTNQTKEDCADLSFEENVQIAF